MGDNEAKEVGRVADTDVAALRLALDSVGIRWVLTPSGGPSFGQWRVAVAQQDALRATEIIDAINTQAADDADEAWRNGRRSSRLASLRMMFRAVWDNDGRDAG